MKDDEHRIDMRCKTPMGDQEDEHSWWKDYDAARSRKRRHHRRRGIHSPAYKYDYRGPARQKDIDNFADTVAENERYTCRINGCSSRVTGMLSMCRVHFYAHRVRGHALLGPTKMRKVRKYVKRYCARYWQDGTFRILTHRCHDWLTEHEQRNLSTTLRQ